jgi:hypothetical protein
VRKQKELSKADRKRLIQVVRDMLSPRGEVVLAYVHGSFARGELFRDLDIAVFRHKPPSSILDYELELETALEGALREAGFKIGVDVRVLNEAPLSFKYHVIKDGKPLIVRDSGLREDFEEITIVQYLDFAPFRRGQLRRILKSDV